MDITIETAVVALVALTAAVAALGIVTSQTGGFTNFLNNQQDTANCDLIQTQADNCLISSKDEIPNNTDSCDIEIPDSCS